MTIAAARITAVLVTLCVGATAQTPPPPGFPPSETKPAEPVVTTPAVNTPAKPNAEKPGADLEFKAPPEKDPPVNPPATVPAVVPAARPQASGPVVVPTALPAPIPGGPKVIEDPAAAPGMVQVAPALPGSASGGRGGSGGPAGVKQGKPYVIGPLDVLEVKVWNDPKLSGMFDVSTDGTISMALIGPVVANGLTAAELTASIKLKLTEVIIEPEVIVQVLRNNSKKYSILGGCGRTGEFPLVGDVTILDALANCGGFREFSNLKKIYVLRGTKQLKFNYREVIKGKHQEQNIPLENGDRIVIPD